MARKRYGRLRMRYRGNLVWVCQEELGGGGGFELGN